MEDNEIIKDREPDADWVLARFGTGGTVVESAEGPPVASGIAPEAARSLSELALKHAAAPSGDDSARQFFKKR